MLQRLIAVFLICLPTALFAAGKIYTWTDENGDVFYGDRPPSEATATEIAIQGKKKSPVTVDEDILPGEWFGLEAQGGEAKIKLNSNGTVTFLQTKADQSVYNYQGIWTYERNSISVITEFSQTAPAKGDFKRSVEPLQLVYNIIGFSENQMELIIGDERFVLDKIN
jgi:hypothetical protein